MPEFDKYDNGDEHLAVVKRKVMTLKCSEKLEDASYLLKMLSWRVQFMQNPDLEEER